MENAWMFHIRVVRITSTIVTIQIVMYTVTDGKNDISCCHSWSW